MMRHLFAVFLLPLLGGCAVRATSVLLQAEQKVRAAETAGAAERAPYEFTLAKTYLDKAKEETGTSDYGAAETLALRAGTYADAALARAGDAPRELPSNPAADVPTEVTPAQTPKPDAGSLDIDLDAP